jgi:hypothetical protein
MIQIKSLATALPEEIKRVEEVHCYYQAAGQAGRFAATQINDSLGRAKAALESNDSTRIRDAFDELRGIE